MPRQFYAIPRAGGGCNRQVYGVDLPYGQELIAHNQVPAAAEGDYSEGGCLHHVAQANTVLNSRSAAAAWWDGAEVPVARPPAGQL